MVNDRSYILGDPLGTVVGVTIKIVPLVEKEFLATGLLSLGSSSPSKVL